MFAGLTAILLSVEQSRFFTCVLPLKGFSRFLGLGVDINLLLICILVSVVINATVAGKMRSSISYRGTRRP